jgi:hypothetical protein
VHELEWLLCPWAHHERVLEERKVDVVGIMGLNDDTLGVSTPCDPELGMHSGKQRIGLRAQSALDYIVLKAGCKPGLRAHVVYQLIVAEVDLPDIDTVVERRREQDQ